MHALNEKFSSSIVLRDSLYSQKQDKVAVRSLDLVSALCIRNTATSKRAVTKAAL
jgi:hypothetical protein